VATEKKEPVSEIAKSRKQTSRAASLEDGAFTCARERADAYQ
jgi:hypothetical protein